MVNSGEFAKRLEKILDHYEVSATSFADSVDVNRSTISHLLSGRNKPSLDFVLKVVRHYPEVNLYWLLNGKGSFPARLDDKKPESQDLPDQSTTHQPDRADQVPQRDDTVKTIERIVIFYSDGTFKSFQG